MVLSAKCVHIYSAVSDFALNADGDKNPWARVSVGLSNMNLTSGQAYY